MKTTKPIDRSQLEQFIQSGGTWQDLQLQFLDAALSLYGGNRTHASKALGVSIRTVRNKMKEWDLRKVNYESTQDQ